MKTLFIGKEILDYRGKSLILPGENEPLTIREILLRAVGSHNFNPDGLNGKKNIMGWKLGEKLFDCKEPVIDLEDAEFEMVKESLSACIFSCLIMGPVEEEIERAEKEGGK